MKGSCQISHKKLLPWLSSCAVFFLLTVIISTLHEEKLERQNNLFTIIWHVSNEFKLECGCQSLEQLLFSRALQRNLNFLTVKKCKLRNILLILHLKMRSEYLEIIFGWSCVRHRKWVLNIISLISLFIILFTLSKLFG